MLLVFGLLATGLCLLLALNTVAAADEVRQRSLITSNADNQDLAQQLQLDIDNRQAPAALASAARALGLVPDPNPAFLVLGGNGAVTVMGSPTPVPNVAQPIVPAATATPASSTPAGTSSSPKIPVSILPGGPR